MQQPIWFDGICDSLLRKLELWHHHYERGELRATRQALLQDGLVDIPVRYLHRIWFTLPEAEALVRILEAKLPKSHLTEQLTQLPLRLRNFRMNHRREHEAPMSFYKAEVAEVLKAVRGARDEAKNVTAPATLDTYLEQQKKQGGPLWKI